MYGFGAIWVPNVRAWCGCCALGAALLVDAVGLVPPMMRGTDGGTNEQYDMKSSREKSDFDRFLLDFGSIFHGFLVIC